MSNEDRRDKALKSFVSTWGEVKGVKMWEDYCKKSDLLPVKPKPKPKRDPAK